jgi:ribosomal protein L32
MQVHVRVCKECGEEYRPDITVCADCGGDLEDIYEEEGAVPAPGRQETEETEAVDLSDHREVFQTARAPDLVPLAERLGEQGVPFHLVEGGAAGAPARYSLLVPEAEVRRALEALADLVAPHAVSDQVHALETHYEAGRYVRCPACGAQQGSGLAECAECGLTLGPAVPTCPRCQSPLEEEGAPCTVCGGPSPTG